MEKEIFHGSWAESNRLCEKSWDEAALFDLESILAGSGNICRGVGNNTWLLHYIYPIKSLFFHVGSREKKGI